MWCGKFNSTSNVNFFFKKQKSSVWGPRIQSNPYCICQFPNLINYHQQILLYQQLVDIRMVLSTVDPRVCGMFSVCMMLPIFRTSEGFDSEWALRIKVGLQIWNWIFPRNPSPPSCWSLPSLSPCSWQTHHPYPHPPGHTLLPRTVSSALAPRTGLASISSLLSVHVNLAAISS